MKKKLELYYYNYAQYLPGMLVLMLALTSTAEAQIEDERIECAVARLLELMEGSFGALIMVVAGIAAIFAAAMGAYRASVGMLVVAVGSFILRALVSIFFLVPEGCDL